MWIQNGFRLWGLGLKDEGLGFGVWGLKTKAYGIWCVGFKIKV